MQLLVTGTRRGRPDVEKWLGFWARKFGWPSLLVVGDASGVDAQAYAWGRRRGLKIARIIADRYLPSPERYHERNRLMVERCRPGDHCLAFPDKASRGTWHCVGLARHAGLKVHVMPVPLLPLSAPK